jgi:hypothetical protein
MARRELSDKTGADQQPKLQRKRLYDCQLTYQRTNVNSKPFEVEQSKLQER